MGSALNLLGGLFAADGLVAAGGLNLEIIDHAFHTGNSPADAHRLSDVPIVENDPAQRGDTIFYRNSDMFVLEKGVGMQGLLHLRFHLFVSDGIGAPFCRHHNRFEVARVRYSYIFARRPRLPNRSALRPSHPVTT